MKDIVSLNDINIDLLPCPLCGGLAVIGAGELPIQQINLPIFNDKRKDNIEYFTQCTECGLKSMGIRIGKRDKYGNKRKFKVSPMLAMQEVAALWNLRTYDDDAESNTKNGDQEVTNE